MGNSFCCVASGETQKRDEIEMITASKLKYPDITRTPTGPAKTPEVSYMTRIVKDASRRVKELKRQ